MSTLPLPYRTDGMASHQMAQSLALPLGLSMSPLLNPTGSCPCGSLYSILDHLHITNNVDKHLPSDFIINVTICSMITGNLLLRATGRLDGMLRGLCLKIIL